MIRNLLSFQTVKLADGSEVKAEFREDSIRLQLYELIEFEDVMAFEWSCELRSSNVSLFVRL